MTYCICLADLIVEIQQNTAEKKLHLRPSCWNKRSLSDKANISMTTFLWEMGFSRAADWYQVASLRAVTGVELSTDATFKRFCFQLSRFMSSILSYLLVYIYLWTYRINLMNILIFCMSCCRKHRPGGKHKQYHLRPSKLITVLTKAGSQLLFRALMFVPGKQQLLVAYVPRSIHRCWRLRI